VMTSPSTPHSSLLSASRENLNNDVKFGRAVMISHYYLLVSGDFTMMWRCFRAGVSEKTSDNGSTGDNASSFLSSTFLAFSLKSSLTGMETFQSLRASAFTCWSATRFLSLMASFNKLASLVFAI
jgi:hypothetical protein